MNKQRIPKLIIKQEDIEQKSSFGLSRDNQVHTCYGCGGKIFYVRKEWGVVVESSEFAIYGYRSKSVYSLRVIGLALYCAECGDYVDNYWNFCYDKDTLVHSLEDLDEDEIPEIENCLREFNMKENFTPLIGNGTMKELKEKLVEYEKDHPLPLDKDSKVKVKSKKKSGSRKDVLL